MRSAIPGAAAAVLCLALTAESRGQPVVYELRPGSVLVNDCPVCGRRAIEIPLQGTFTVTGEAPGVDSRTYDIADVDFQASDSSGLTVKGTGKYHVVFPGLQSLTLDLDIGDETGIHFDSMGDKNAQPWPFLDIHATESPGSATRIYNLQINAAPQGTDKTTYQLKDGSSFTDDCPPCAHVIIPIPISGTFTLAKVDENTLGATYRVDAVDFKDTDGSHGLHVTGLGRYVQGGEVALMQEMDLDIDVTLAGNERIASMASQQGPPGAAFPDIDVALDEQNPPSIGSVYRLHIIASPSGVQAAKFRRGDANGDGTGDLSDAVFILSWLFQAGTTPTCQDAADGNDDGTIDLTDAVYVLTWLFQGGPEPPAPGPTACGPDTTPSGKITEPCVYPACK